MFGFGGDDSGSDDDVSYRKQVMNEERLSDQVYGDSENANERAGHAPRRCTDPICWLVFVASAAAFFGFIYHYCWEHGDLRRLYHGYDYLGRLCGVDVDDQNQTLGDFLFWCQKPNTFPIGLDLAHPICIHKCPLANETVTCAQFPPVFGEQKPIDPYGSFKQEITYKFAPVLQYNSRVWAHRYCMPEDSDLIKQVTDFISNQGFASKVLFRVGETLSAWGPLLVSALLAVVLGFVFLAIVLYLANCLVWVCLVVLILGPLIAGGYLLWVAFDQEGGVDGLRGTGDSQWDGIIGCALIVIGLIFGCLACCARKAIQTAVAVLQATCYCMFSMPSLLFEPIINVIVKMVVLCFLLLGFAWLLSCGEIQKASVEQAFVASVPGSEMSGVLRTFHYKEDEVYYIFTYIFFIFWIMEIFVALGQFTISYAVQLWYFTPYPDGEEHKEDVPSCGILHGMCVGLTFHLGSLAFGAFIIAVFRIVRLLARLFISQTKDANAAVACIGKCVECCLGCCQSCIEYLNKNAYMDIAITSSHFCPAAKRAFGVILQYLPEASILNGATWVIQVLGMGAISAGSAYLTWLILGWQYSDPETEHFVESKELVTIIATIIALLVAWSFMTVFDTVADTILYCFAVEQKRRSTTPPMYPPGVRYAPHELDDLIKETVGDKF
jgi:hypothetical protein